MSTPITDVSAHPDLDVSDLDLSEWPAEDLGDQGETESHDEGAMPV